MSHLSSPPSHILNQQLHLIHGYHTGRQYDTVRPESTRWCWPDTSVETLEAKERKMPPGVQMQEGLAEQERQVEEKAGECPTTITKTKCETQAQILSNPCEGGSSSGSHQLAEESLGTPTVLCMGASGKGCTDGSLPSQQRDDLTRERTMHQEAPESSTRPGEFCLAPNRPRRPPVVTTPVCGSATSESRTQKHTGLAPRLL